MNFESFKQNRSNASPNIDRSDARMRMKQHEMFPKMIHFFFLQFISILYFSHSPLSSCFTFISLCSIPLCSILFKWFELICFTQFRCLIFNSFKILLIFVFLHNICITSFSGSPIAALALKYMSWHIVRDDRTVPAMKFGRDVVFRSLASECDTIH